jgi:hypothetical protein
MDLTKTLASIFCFVLLMSALGVAVYQLIIGKSVSPLIASVLGAGIGYSLHVLGLDRGVTLEKQATGALETIRKAESQQL